MTSGTAKYLRDDVICKCPRLQDVSRQTIHTRVILFELAVLEVYEKAVLTLIISTIGRFWSAKIIKSLLISKLFIGLFYYSLIVG